MTGAHGASDPYSRQPLLLALRGELDLAGAPRLAGALEAAIAAGHERIVLEVRELDVIDCASVALIERTRRQLRAQGREPAVRHPPQHLRRLIALWATLPAAGDEVERASAPVVLLPWAGAAVVEP